LESYGYLISFVGAGFSAGFATYVVDKLKNRKKDEDVNLDDYL
jgi:hypothetical protein